MSTKSKITTEAAAAPPLASAPLLDHGDAHGAGEPSARTIPDNYLATDANGAPLIVEPIPPTAFVRHRIVREIVVGQESAE